MKKTHIKNIVQNYLLHNETCAYFLSKYCLRLYLKMFYEHWTKRRLNFCQPEDFNQALLKLSWENSHNPKMRELIPLCVDKYAVREYVASKGYEDTLNEIYGVYDNVDAIDYDALPNQFVMKMTNASGRNWICIDKSVADWPAMKKQFAEWLKDTEFGWLSGEWQYALIKPRIVVEKYLETLGESSLIDYKFHCFHGEPYSCFVGYNRDMDDPHGKVCFDDYDMAWNRTERILPSWHMNRRMIPQPKNWNRMVQMARDVCRDFEYVRFDLYEINGKIVFGEITFTPQGCVQEFYTDEALKEMLEEFNK